MLNNVNVKFILSLRRAGISKHSVTPPSFARRCDWMLFQCRLCATGCPADRIAALFSVLLAANSQRPARLFAHLGTVPVAPHTFLRPRCLLGGDGDLVLGVGCQISQRPARLLAHLGDCPRSAPYISFGPDASLAAMATLFSALAARFLSAQHACCTPGTVPVAPHTFPTAPMPPGRRWRPSRRWLPVLSAPHASWHTWGLSPWRPIHFLRPRCLLGGDGDLVLGVGPNFSAPSTPVGTRPVFPRRSPSLARSPRCPRPQRCPARVVILIRHSLCSTPCAAPRPTRAATAISAIGPPFFVFSRRRCAIWPRARARARLFTKTAAASTFSSAATALVLSPVSWLPDLAGLCRGSSVAPLPLPST